MLCRRLCSSGGEFQITPASKLNSASCNAGGCCIRFYLLQEEFSPLPSPFLNNHFPVNCFLLPSKTGLSGWEKAAGCLLCFRRCPWEWIGTTDHCRQQGGKAATHLPRPALMGASGPALLSSGGVRAERGSVAALPALVILLTV